MRRSWKKRAVVAGCMLPTIAQISLAIASSIVADPEPHLLILNGTDPYLPAYPAMRVSVANQSAERTVPFSESLDAQRFSEEAPKPESLAPLAKKYKGLRIDAVVVVPRPAREPFKRQGERL